MKPYEKENAVARDDNTALEANGSSLEILTVGGDWYSWCT